MSKKVDIVTIHGREIKVANLAAFEALMPVGAKVAVKGFDGNTFGIRKWANGKVTTMRDKAGNPIPASEVRCRW